MAYSQKVRQEILKRVENGESMEKISKDTNISVPTILSWKKGRTYKNKKREKIKPKRRTTEYDKQKILKLKEIGYSNEEVAKTLEISIETVNKYATLFAKTGLFNKTEADKNRNARKHGINLSSNILETNENDYIIMNLKDEQIESLIGNVKNQQSDEIDKSEMQQLEQIKREISSEVRFNKEPTKEKEDKIRQYIQLCNNIYNDKKMPKLELQFLENAIEKVPSNYNDIAKLTKRYISMKLYVSALKVIMKTKDMEKLNVSEEEKIRLENIGKALFRICTVQEAINTIKRGNYDSELISRLIKLPKKEINILRIKISNEPTKFLKPKKREEIIKLLLSDKDPSIIREKLGISQFEMEDIIEQSKYKKRTSRNNKEDIQIKQDTYIRMTNMFTILGVSPQNISEVLEITPEEVEKNIQSALKVGLIEQDQINGIDILKPQDIQEFDEMER